MLVELDGVSRRYGNVHALRGLSAHIDGRVIGLLGPNGAGKSTLLKSLLGLIRFQGRARVLGLDPAHDSFRIRDRVGYMAEMDSFLAGMSAVELCAYAGELSGLPRTEAMQRAHAALYYAGVEEKRYLPVEGYSTGLKQRVKLAQALVHDPEMLFLDEPTNGLDPRSRSDMLELIEELPAKRGCSVILSTHLLPDVDRICDQVIILQEGELRYAGSIASLREREAQALSQSFDVEVKSGGDRLSAALREAGCEVRDASELALSVALPAEAGSRLLFDVAHSCQVQLRRVEVQRESLEDAFLRLVGAPR